jgi:SAM-dependent methyltransferase
VINEFFRPEMFPQASFDVICCFQIMDHLPDPASFLRGVRSLLSPGGHFIAVNHNIRALMTRVLGEKSPMYDIEHIYLFDTKTFPRLLRRTGFDVAYCRGMVNVYTLDHALKMFPLPAPIKRVSETLLRYSHAGSLRLPFPGGNMVAVARPAVTHPPA